MASASQQSTGQEHHHVRWAGLQPASIHPATGTLMFLVAREAFGRSRGTWAGFSGRRAPCDGTGPDAQVALAIAAREGFEEALGLLGTIEQLTTALQTQGMPVWSHKDHGALFVLPVRFDAGLPETFAAVRAAAIGIQHYAGAHRHAYSPFLEKDAIAWVEARDLCAPAPSLPLRPAFASTVHSAVEAATAACMFPPPIPRAAVAVCAQAPAGQEGGLVAVVKESKPFLPPTTTVATA